MVKRENANRLSFLPRWICVIMGVLLIALGIYLGIVPEKLNTAGCVALIVECGDYRQLKQAMDTNRRLTAAISAASLSEEALNSGMEVMIKVRADGKAPARELLAATGARGLLVEGEDAGYTIAVGMGYMTSYGGAENMILPDYILDGNDANSCAAAISAISDMAQSGGGGIALYTYGEDMPLAEVVERLNDVRIVFVSQIISPPGI